MKRNRISHETSVLLKRIDFTQALAFGIGATVVHLLGGQGQNVLAVSVAACILYSAAVTFHNISAIMAVAFFAVISSALAPTHDVVRLTVFASTMTFVAGRTRPLPPFILLMMLWLAHVSLPQIFPEMLPPPNPRTLVPMLFFEVFGCLTLSLIFSSSRAQVLLRRRMKPIGTRSFMVQAVTFPAIFAVSLAVWLALAALGIPLDRLLHALGERPASAVGILLFLIALPMVVGILVARSIIGFVNNVGNLANPNNRLLQKDSDQLSFREFGCAIAKLRSEIDSSASALRVAQIRIKELLHQAAQKESEIQEREISAFNLTNLMDNAPWGFTAVSGSGLIIEANETFLKLLHLERAETSGAHFSTLSGVKPWVPELQSLLNWVTRDLRKLLGKPPIKHYTSSLDGSYLEILVEISRSSESDLVDTKRDEHFAPSDVAISVYLRDLPDIRDFQLQLLSPNKVEILGAEALEVAKELRKNLSNLLGHLTLATAKLTATENPFLASLLSRPEGMELLLLLKDVDKLARQSSTSLDELFSRTSTVSLPKAQHNLSVLVQNSLDYLHQLLNLDERIVVSSYGGMGAVVSVSDAETLLPESSEGDVLLTASQDELSRFLAYLAAMIRHFMSRTTDIQVSLGYEAIGTGTANIIPGSYPGNYARIVLHHAGQSITANMLAQRPLSMTKDLNSLEVGLALLTLQTKYLGGFLSVQSTQAKGTTLTIYLPVEASVRPDNLTKVHRSRKHFKTPTIDVEPHASAKRKALFVGADADAVLAGTNMLKHLGYAVNSQTPEALSEKLRKPVGFSGSGFGSLGERSDDDDKVIVRPLVDGSDHEVFELLVVNIELVTSAAVRLLQDLESEYPEAATLLLIDSSPEAHEIFGGVAHSRQTVRSGRASSRN